MTDTTNEAVAAPEASVKAALSNTVIIHLPPATPAAGKAVVAGTAVAKRHTNRPKAPVFSENDVESPLFGIPFLPPIPRLTPDIYYDAEVPKFTRFNDGTGASATLRQDSKDHNKVALGLSDDRGVAITHGDRRGFEVVDKNIKADPWKLLDDTLTCPNGRRDMNTNETESVARDRIQRFAFDHPRIADALRGVELPVTVIGGLPATFAKAVDTPTQFRACPEGKSGILLERLTEKTTGR